MDNARDVMIATRKHILARAERLGVNERLVLALELLPGPHEATDVERVLQNLPQRVARELWTRVRVGTTFGVEALTHGVNRRVAASEQLERTAHRPGLLLVNDNRGVAVARIAVAKRDMTGQPALPNLLIHPLPDLLAEVIDVMLGERPQDSLQQPPGRVVA